MTHREQERTRREQLIALLVSMNDGLPVPTRRDHSTPGFVHHAVVRETCEDCLANDKRTKGCETCHGRGFIEAVRERDPYAVEKVQPYGMDVSRHERTRERDAQIARLEQQTREPWKSSADELADANSHPFVWERERARMRRAYDYQALHVALELLRDHDEGAHRALHAMYVYGWAEPSVVYETACERGLRFLEERMPDPMRAPGDEKHHAAERQQRRRAA